MFLFWRRRNKMEKARLEQRLQNYNKDLHKYAANVDRRKRAIVQEFESVRRTSGHSLCGLPVSGRQGNAYVESRYSRSGFRLSEKRLMAWKQSEKELERFLKRTQIGKLPNPQPGLYSGRTTAKYKKCPNPRRKFPGEKNLKDQTSLPDYTAKIFKLYLENDRIRSELEYKTPMDKSPKLDKNDFMKIQSTSGTEDDIVKDKISDSDDNKNDIIRRTVLKLDGNESTCFNKSASRMTEKSKNNHNIDQSDMVRNIDNEEDGECCVGVINEEAPYSPSFKKRSNPEIKPTSGKPSVDDMMLNKGRDFRGQRTKTRMSGSAKKLEIRTLQSDKTDKNKTDLLTENVKCDKNSSACKSKSSLRSRVVSLPLDCDDIENGYIKVNNISGDAINVGNISGDAINVSSISGNAINVGNISGDAINVSNIPGDCIKVSNISSDAINVVNNSVDESQWLPSNIKRPLVNTKKESKFVDIEEDANCSLRAKSGDIHGKMEATCNEDDGRQSTAGLAFTAKPEPNDVKCSPSVLRKDARESRDEQNKIVRQLTFECNVSPGSTSSNDVKCETTLVKHRSETSINERQGKLVGQMRRKSVQDLRKRPKSSIYSAPTRPSTTPIRQRRWTTDVSIEYPPAIHTKMSLEHLFRTALVFPKSTRKTRLDRLVDEFSPDLTERVRRERINELKDHSLRLSHLVNKFNLDNPQKTAFND